MTRYRTIVADPPWHYQAFATQSRHAGKWEGRVNYTKPLPYPSMSVDEIAALPVADLAASDSRLFLWTTNRYLPTSFDVMSAWGFGYRQTLVWHKTDGNMGGGIAPNSAEFVLVGTRGAPGRLGRMPSVIRTSAPKVHSQKPEAWLDYFESVSPAPYLEMFARRARFGWDYWGDQSLGTAEVA